MQIANGGAESLRMASLDDTEGIGFALNAVEQRVEVLGRSGWAVSGDKGLSGELGSLFKVGERQKQRSRVGRGWADKMDGSHG